MRPTVTDYQNGTAWNIELLRDDGTPLKVLDTVGAFHCQSVVNNWGSFSLALPADFNSALVGINRRVRFNRKPAGGTQYVEFEGLIRRIQTEADDRGLIRRTIAGPSLEYLLGGRVIADYAGSAAAEKTAAADNMMKAFVREQLGASASASRQLSSTLFSVEGDFGLGPSLTKAASYRNLLDVLRDLADSARQAGTEVYFYLRPTPPGFTFVTSTGQPGMDRTGTGTQLVFGLEWGNLKNPTLTEDWMDEANYAYALGLGTGSGRTVTTASATRGTQDLLALREATIQHNYTNGGAEAASSKVTSMRPVTMFSGDLESVPGSIYGWHWKFGDRVKVTFAGKQFTALARSVTCSVDEGGRETIRATAEAYL